MFDVGLIRLYVHIYHSNVLDRIHMFMNLCNDLFMELCRFNCSYVTHPKRMVFDGEEEPEFMKDLAEYSFKEVSY